MIITDFDSFNEESIWGIDLKKIKEEAEKFARSKDCVKLFSKVDSDILNSALRELKKLKEKWGSLDILAKKLIQKSQNKNEGVAGTIILATFGIHAFLKLLIALKKQRGFIGYLGSLFYSEGDFKTIRDAIIMVVFLIYAVVYIFSSKIATNNIYRTNNGAYINIPFKWNGIHDYILIDDVGKHYNVKRTGYGKYDILYNDRKIGTTDSEDIFNLNGEKVAIDADLSLEDAKEEKINIIKIDLEKVMTGKYSKSKEKEVITRRDQIDKLQQEIDSLNKTIYENVDMAKKIFKEHGKDYDKIVNTKEEEFHNLDPDDKYFLNIKNILTKNNNLGFLGLFANLAVKDQSSSYKFKLIYDKIINNKDILNNLRDNNGNIISIFDFDKYEDLDDSLDRLESWRIVNQFMRKFPSEQKALIWKDGFYVDDLRNKSEFLTSSIIKISTDEILSRLFLSKISAAKTKENIIESIIKITKNEPWDYDYWLNKLKSHRNVYVTWSSKEEKQIICIVNSFRAITKIAYMTNWCITRSSDYFSRYSEYGFQCILYDFNYPITSNDCIIGFSLNSRSNPLQITACHNKSDHQASLPDKFTTGSNNKNKYWENEIKPEFIKIDLVSAALKFDRTFIKAIKNIIMTPITKGLNKPGFISNFLDFYES